MTILVDQARWPWRGTKWCHLVSDDNLAELHAFAGTLGARRVGFQGDHYDIDIDTREIAIAKGATPCDSRELIRRMRSAGLRLRPNSFTKWELAKRSDLAAHDPTEVLSDPRLAPFLTHSHGWFVLTRPRDDGQLSSGVVVFGSGYGSETATALPALPSEDPESGLFSRFDDLGNWSVERISPPPTDQE